MAASKRFVCIHGHFYQPPRENPWLETVETQDSAAPYHDWNERICAECYATNGAARILNIKNQITRIVNNYARISFNFGPTLLSWLKENAPRTYRMILDGERRSRKSYQRPQLGHGPGLQPHHHAAGQHAATASRRSAGASPTTSTTTARRRKACGSPKLPPTPNRSSSWPSTASSSPLLAPHQCKRIRPLKRRRTAHPGPTPPTPPSTPPIPTSFAFAPALSIAVFFYNGPVSRAIAFEGLLNSGEAFAARLKAGFNDTAQPQLVHVATDGESYGHHHKHGEMALAYALRLLEQDKTVKLTNYGSFLEQFPPEYECEIVEDTSWSCIHGVERWRSNCGCNGGRPFNQLWRAPLRQALDELRDALPRSRNWKAASSSTMCGPRATPTSMSSSTAAANVDALLQCTHQLTRSQTTSACAHSS